MTTTKTWLQPPPKDTTTITLELTRKERIALQTAVAMYLADRAEEYGLAQSNRDNSRSVLRFFRDQMDAINCVSAKLDDAGV